LPPPWPTDPGAAGRVKRLCPDCEVIYANGSQDATKQQTQAEAAITEGADVLVRRSCSRQSR